MASNNAGQAGATHPDHLYRSGGEQTPGWWSELVDLPPQLYLPGALGAQQAVLGVRNVSAPDRTNPKDLVGVTKCPLWLVPPAGNIFEAQVFALGAAKYGPYNWRKNAVKKSIYVSAILRHLYAMMDGQWLDPESGLPHLAHIRANTNIMLDAEVHGNLINDMDYPGDAAKLLGTLTEVRV